MKSRIDIEPSGLWSKNKVKKQKQTRNFIGRIFFDLLKKSILSSLLREKLKKLGSPLGKVLSGYNCFWNGEIINEHSCCKVYKCNDTYDTLLNLI